MRGCWRFLAGGLAILFVITAVFALFLSNLFAVVADREIVKESLANLDRLAAETVPALVVQSLEAQARQQGLVPPQLDTAVLEQSMALLLPPGWLEAQTATAVDLVYDGLENGDLKNTELVIDISPLQARFRGEPGQEVVSAIVNGLPPCAALANPAELFSSAAIPSCLPPGVPTAQIAQEAHARLVQAMDSNPQLGSQAGQVRLPLFSPELLAQNETVAQARAQLLRLQQIFSLAQAWGWLLWLLPAGCLLLIALLAVRSWSEWGQWWGWPLLATAVIGLFIALVFPALTTLLLRQLPADPTAVTLTLRQAAFRLVTAVTDTWLSRVYLQAGIMLVVGVLFLILGQLSRARNS